MISLYLILSILSGISFADDPLNSDLTWQCTDAKWVGTPAMNSKGNLEGTLTSDCSLTLTSAGSIGNLNNEILSHISEDYEIHSGPIDSSFKSLPSKHFDVTSHLTEDSDRVHIRKDLEIATDLANQLVSDEKSTSINGEGNAAYLRFVHFEQTVTKSGQGNTSFTLKLIQTVEVNKPSYAPEFIFIPQAKKGLLKSFNLLIKDSSAKMIKRLTIQP